MSCETTSTATGWSRARNPCCGVITSRCPALASNAVHGEMERVVMACLRAREERGDYYGGVQADGQKARKKARGERLLTSPALCRRNKTTCRADGLQAGVKARFFVRRLPARGRRCSGRRPGNKAQMPRKGHADHAARRLNIGGVDILRASV